MARKQGEQVQSEITTRMSPDLTPVLVTTEYRGVFFGYVKWTDDIMTKDILLLEQCRCAVYWSSDVKGFLGLASNGPTPSCRIGPPAPLTGLKKVTSVTRVSPKATEAWEKGYWSA